MATALRSGRLYRSTQIGGAHGSDGGIVPSRVTTHPSSRIWDLAGLNVMRILHHSRWGGTVHSVNPAVAETLAGRDGSLVLRLAGGAELRVPKRERYESWHTFGHGDFADASMLCPAHEGPPWAE